MSASDLYQKDFHAWALEQAELLRDPGRRRSNAIEWERVAEEIESLGRSDYRACASAVERILEHLLKIEFLRAPEPVRHWRKEISNFRIDLERDLSPSLAAALPDELEAFFSRSRRRVLADLLAREEAPPVDFPVSNPYTWEDVLGHDQDWTPEPRT